VNVEDPLAGAVSFKGNVCVRYEDGKGVDRLDDFARREPISKSCEITQADNLNRIQRLSMKAQCLK